MKKIDRLIGIIYALKENKKLTAKDISDIFEVSERTVYRDIDALSQLNVPIKAFEGFSGGYEIDESYFIPTLAFKENEVLYLLICLKIGEIISVPNMKADYESLKYKLLNILDENTKKQHLELLERINFDITSMVLSDFKQDITKKIIESYFQNRDLIIEYYHPKKDECIERRITMRTLTFFNGGWYLDGYCHLRKAIRVFRLDRIKDIRLSEEGYSLSDISEYLKESSRKDDVVKVILEMDKRLFETIKNDNIFVDVEVRNYDDKVELKFYTNEIDYIINLAIRNFEDVRIIEPQYCIDRLKQICEKILDKY